jgi:hypothetical protein
MAKKDKVEDRFIEINENELDKEWVEQPVLYFRWARKLADARLKVDEAKAELELVTAELDSKIREDPESYGIEKLTEAGVKSTILIQEEYTDALQTFNAARHQVNILDAGVNALEHRKRALEKLVDLYARSYFAPPQASGKNRKEFDKKATRRRSVHRRDE